MEASIELKAAIEAALRRASEEAAAIYVEPKNSRSYGCSVAQCVRPAYAGGMCNAHYLRLRKGRSLDEPVRARKREGRCAACGVPAGAKGGWGLCQRHYREKRYAVVKDAVVAFKGGRCEKCRQVFQRAVFDLHHLGGKTESPSAMLINRSAERIANELSSCVLLCANCHRMEHHGDEQVSDLHRPRAGS